MNYLWTDQMTLPHFPSLEKDIDTDVLIIGGGMAGVLCALLLEQKGVDYLLVEATNIGHGVTRGTTAVLTAQHSTFYTELTLRFGEDAAQKYLDANLKAVQQFRTFSQSIDCDFEEKPSLLYSRTDRSKLEEEAKMVRKLGFPAKFTTNTSLPFPVAGAVQFPDMAQFHPLKFLFGAAKGLRIYENTFVRRLEGTTAYTDTARIKARRVIVASHFPFLNRYGLYFAKLYQTRSFVLAIAGAPDLHATYEEDTESGIYFRNYGKLLLVGGGDHRTGTKKGGFPMVRDFVRQYFPKAQEKYAWAAQDCMSLDGVPYIGAYSPALPNVYVATGFNEWGMTSSMVAASILSDKMAGRENAFAPVFCPERSMLRKQLFCNLVETMGNFVLPKAPRCPHMGCALKWNKDERTWDCPCHGSRFDEQGRLLDNPAMRDCHVD